MTAVIRLHLFIAVFAVLGLSQASQADEIVPEYDILTRDSLVVVWVDFGRFLGNGEIQYLKESIDVLIECRLTLVIPRRFFADSKVASARHRVQVRYRPITEDFMVITPEPAGPFRSLAGLMDYLTDSVEVPLVELDSLDAWNRYALDLRIASITMTNFNLAEKSEEFEDDPESPMRFLFRQFLDLTGYGRTEHHVKSRTFSLDEIPTHP